MEIASLNFQGSAAQEKRFAEFFESSQGSHTTAATNGA